MMHYLSYGPSEHQGSADARLPRIVADLHQRLSKTQKTLSDGKLVLDRAALEDLAGILVDFAVDLHCGIGLWEAYEKHNLAVFGTPLPLSMRPEEPSPPTGIHPARVRHLLWVVYPELKDGLILRPLHHDLLRVAEAAHGLLNERILPLPKDAGVGRFLGTPNEYGWDVKRKLVWLGTRSYLFRLFCENYAIEECDGKLDIGDMDDFVCAQCTRWSGLGAVDILAEVLDISEPDRGDLRSWHERHLAAYKILSCTWETLRALNIVSGEEYVVRLNMRRHPFKPGQLVYGSLVPWRGEWYWSGEQRTFDAVTQAAIDYAKANIVRSIPQIVCRYWKDYERQVRERADKLHVAMMKYHGNDLTVYPDGLAAAADWQKELREHWESMPQDQVKDAVERLALKDGRPNMSIPDEVLNATGGIGLFLNPEEGQEIMTGFGLLVAGLRRHGVGITEAEADAIQGFIRAEACSPRFVRRLVAEHGAESIRAAFMLPRDGPAYWLDYLLRCYKGHYYKKRYPSLAVV